MEDVQQNPEITPQEVVTKKTSLRDFLTKYKLYLIILPILIILIASVVFVFENMADKQSGKSNQNDNEVESNTNNDNNVNQNDSNYGSLGDANSLDPVEKGKSLSGGKCSGTGSTELTYAPMKPSDLSVIIPYGLMIGGHVTPIDHQYYWGKVQMGNADMYDVLSPGKGRLVELSYRDRSGEGSNVKGDYRGVIMYTCTFFSYFDLATSVSEKIQAALPKDWEKTGRVQYPDIEVEAGEVIGKVGGQSLDFAVWDTTKTLSKLLVPTAYNNREPWKLNTVSPLDYFSESVKTSILPYYVRSAEPVDGIIDYDIDGTASGNWFLLNSNGYAGFFDYSEQSKSNKHYWFGHLSLAPDHIDPDNWIFSTADLNGQPAQYSIKTISNMPDTVKVGDGVVKYELMEISYEDGDSKHWRGERAASGVHVVEGRNVGTLLIELTKTRELKVEVFLGKTPSEVSSFTNSAKLYDRSDNAKMLDSNTAF